MFTRIFQWAASASLIACIATGCTPPTSGNHLGGGGDQEDNISTEEMQFSEPALGEKFFRFDSYCRQSKNAQGHQRPYQVFSEGKSGSSHFAEWATFANQDDRNPLDYIGIRELHALSMSAFYDADSESREQIVGFSAYGRWKPAVSGWGAWVEYRTFLGADNPNTKSPDEHFEFSVFFCQASDPSNPLMPTLDFYRNGSASFTHEYLVEVAEEEDPIAYEFRVNTRSPNSHHQLSTRQPDADILLILSSPEVMRDFGLAALDELENKIKEEIPSNTAVRSVRVVGSKEKSKSLDHFRPLNDEELAEVMDIAHEHVQSRRDALMDHYREMYDAVRNALPVDQLK